MLILETCNVHGLWQIGAGLGVKASECSIVGTCFAGFYCQIVERLSPDMPILISDYVWLHETTTRVNHYD